MRNSIEKWLQDIWYSDNTPPWYLRMLVPVYRAGYKFDHRHSEPDGPGANSPQSGSSSLSGRNSHDPGHGTNTDDAGHDHPGLSPKTPLLVVGNITVGGSGKTPLVIALCNIAQTMGVKVGVASTGYGRKSTETLLVHANSDTTECGDEPVLIATRTGVPVIVARRRQDAIARLRQMNLDLIVSDDGLQTAGLHRDIEICVVDGARGVGNGELLPAGPLREPASRLQNVDYIVSNGEWLSKPVGSKVAVMTLEGHTLVALDGTSQVSADEFFSRQAHTQPGHQTHLFAGIGNPERFFASVRRLNLNASDGAGATKHLHEHRLADHHVFVKEDFESVAAGATIIMTEKDAVKCRKLDLENAWYLPVDAELDEDFTEWFRQQLTNLNRINPDVE